MGWSGSDLCAGRVLFPPDSHALPSRRMPGTVAPATDAVEQALAAERLRNTRLINTFRLQGVSVVFGLILLLHWTRRWIVPPPPLLLAYWAAALGVWWAGRRSARIAQIGGLSIALIDMPMVFLLVWTTMTRLRAAGFANDALTSAPQGGLYYAILLLLA